MFLNYFYEQEVEEYSYINIPRVLMTKKIYKDLSSDAKVVYGILLDKLKLAAKYDWVDESGQAYIIYRQEELQRDMKLSKRKVIETLQELENIGLIERIQRGARRADVIYLKKFLGHEVSEEIMESLNCGRNKAIKCLQELDGENGIGLIEKRRQGMGKSSIIYVKNFVMATEAGCKKFEKQTSGSPKNKLLEVCKKDSNYNNINYTNKNNTESNPIRTEEEPIKEPYSCPNLVKEQIEYEVLWERYPYYREQLDELLSLIEEILENKSETIVISGSNYPVKLVQERFHKLDSMHIEYVLECLQENTSKVRNMKKYLLATLFNASVTIKSFYQAKVNYDMMHYSELVQ